MVVWAWFGWWRSWISILAVYRFLKDPHGVAFHTTRWVGGTVAKLAVLVLIIVVSANIWAFSERFIFHVPKQEIIRKMYRIDDALEHWSSVVVQKLNRKLI
jgi:hypothetical protein